MTPQTLQEDAAKVGVSLRIEDARALVAMGWTKTVVDVAACSKPSIPVPLFDTALQTIEQQVAEQRITRARRRDFW